MCSLISIDIGLIIISNAITREVIGMNFHWYCWRKLLKRRILKINKSANYEPGVIRIQDWLVAFECITTSKIFHEARKIEQGCFSASIKLKISIDWLSRGVWSSISTFSMLIDSGYYSAANFSALWKIALF